MLLSQYRDEARVHVVARSGTEAYRVRSSDPVHDIARACAERGERLSDRLAALGFDGAADLDRLDAEARLPLRPLPAAPRATGRTGERGSRAVTGASVRPARPAGSAAARCKAAPGSRGRGAGA